MQGLHAALEGVFVVLNDDGDLHFGGADEVDVDAGIAQRGEHARGNPVGADHACADGRDLDDVVVDVEFASLEPFFCPRF